MTFWNIEIYLCVLPVSMAPYPLTQYFVQNHLCKVVCTYFCAMCTQVCGNSLTKTSTKFSTHDTELCANYFVQLILCKWWPNGYQAYD